MLTTTKPRRCKAPGCPNKFTQYQSFVVWCSPTCGAVIAQAKLAKAKRVAATVERKADQEKRQAFKRIPELIAAAQIQFNTFIRLRDKDKGCFVCGRPFKDLPGQVQHAGHVRSRGAAGHLRFNEDNCLGECEGCNGPRGAKPHQIKAGAIARIGQERYEALENDNTPHKWKREELVAIKQKYAALVRELRSRTWTS